MAAMGCDHLKRGGVPCWLPPAVPPALTILKSPCVREKTCLAGFPQILNTSASYTVMKVSFGRPTEDRLAWEQ
jgi:hypothetical protein